MKSNELTWEDIMTIDIIIHNLPEGNHSIKGFYTEVLRRFNEAKEEKK